MPQIFRIGPYIIYFWSNENDPLEPIHVHIAEGRATANGTRCGLPAKGKLCCAITMPKSPLLFCGIFCGLLRPTVTILSKSGLPTLARSITSADVKIKSAAPGVGAPETAKGCDEVWQPNHIPIPIHSASLSRLLKAKGEPFSPVFQKKDGTRMDDATLHRRWKAFIRELDIHMGAEVYRNKIIKSVVSSDLTPCPIAYGILSAQTFRRLVSRSMSQKN